jgi:hypothetical protein
VANLEGQVRARYHTISQLQMPTEAPTAPENPAPALSLSHKPIHAMNMMERIPDPEKFHGNHSQHCSFLGQLRIKLIVNHDRFPDE